MSLRSKWIDIAKIVVTFSGGGHKVATGFTLEGYCLEEAIEAVLGEMERLELLKT